MTEAEMQTAVGLIRHGWAGRIPVDVIERLIRRMLPAITDDDLAAVFEQAVLNEPVMLRVWVAVAGLMLFFR